jgi:hypothetical protein
MKRLIIYTIALFLAWYSCGGQTGQKKNEKANEKNLPGTNITVNKEYDEDGNLIQYDSTCSWHFSGSERDSLFNDSTFFNFKRYFDRKHHLPGDSFFSDDFFKDRIFDDKYFDKKFFNDEFFSDKFFSDRFFGDSLFFHNPYGKDFFSDHFSMSREWLEKLFRDLDSLNNNIFRKHFSNPGQPGKENDSHRKSLVL